MTNIVLIGFTACGKSSVGRALAEALTLRFVDLDQVIESLSQECYGRPMRCPEIYRELGADTFRLLEDQALRKVAALERTVLATGGGAPLNPKNREHLRRFGAVIALTASLDTICERMTVRGFPAYLGANPTRAALAAEIDRRQPLYRRMAVITVNTDRRQIADIVTTIIARLKEKRLWPETVSEPS